MGTITHTDKVAELEVASWFLSCNWLAFLPLVDHDEIDLVVRDPQNGNLISVQVKHKQVDAKNVGRLVNEWQHGAPFDLLVFYDLSRMRGVVLSAARLKKETGVLWFYREDKEGYARGPVREKFANVSFDFAGTEPLQRHELFIAKVRDALDGSNLVTHLVT